MKKMKKPDFGRLFNFTFSRFIPDLFRDWFFRLKLFLFTVLVAESEDDEKKGDRYQRTECDKWDDVVDFDISEMKKMVFYSFSDWVDRAIVDMFLVSYPSLDLKHFKGFNAPFSVFNYYIPECFMLYISDRYYPNMTTKSEQDGYKFNVTSYAPSSSKTMVENNIGKFDYDFAGTAKKLGIPVYSFHAFCRKKIEESISSCILEWNDEVAVSMHRCVLKSLYLDKPDIKFPYRYRMIDGNEVTLYCPDDNISKGEEENGTVIVTSYFKEKTDSWASLDLVRRYVYLDII